jgi:hypothetical protein
MKARCLRRKACQFRRAAREINDDKARRTLNEAADQYEEQAAQIEKESGKKPTTDQG